jgi:16S rRNA (cytidine1402-2'-O)-methyltransferase
MERGRLYVCATPIGNLGDASPRLRDVLARVGAIACEDTRHTRKLLSALEIPAPRLLAHHEHNERDSAAGLVQMLEEGTDVAVVSDAGMPGVSDPGAVVVRSALAAGIEVVVVPGPSAIAAAVAVSGSAHDGFTFVGFLPRSATELRELVLHHSQQVVVALESPARVAASLSVLAEAQPERRVVIARELTKAHEQTLAGTAAEISQRVQQEPVRGEVVLVFDAMRVERDTVDVDPRLVDLVVTLAQEGMSMKDASRVVATWSGERRKVLYDAALQIRDI